MNTFDDLKGKTAFITGASAGLGRHFAQLLAANGMNVVVAARRRQQLHELAAELAALGVQALPLVLDVTDPQAVSAAIETAFAEVGSVDVVVNNAGISVNGSSLELSAADWDLVQATNTKGAFMVATQAARRMRERGRPGSIINIASVLAYRQAQHVAAYAASKAALVQLTKSLALELARYQIRVNALAPGYILTDLNRAYFATDQGKQLIERIPARRLGSPSDLDGPLLLLASEASRFMTGAVLPVDGGYLLTPA